MDDRPADDHREGAFEAALLLDDAHDLYEHAPCGFVSTDADGIVVKANATFARLTGHDRAGLIGSRFRDLLTPGARIFYETHLAPMLRLQGSVREIAVDIRRPDGTRLPVLLNSVIVNNPDGAPLGVRTAVFDATERRAYETELLAAVRRAEASERHARQLAETLQASLIPPTPPTIPGVDIGAGFRPAGTGWEVGGDFFDVFETPRGGWAIAIGDVCGKGAAAAVITSLARHTIRAAAMRSARPAAVLALLNAALRRQAPQTMCTAMFVQIRAERHRGLRGVVASGGHPLPLIVQPDGRVRTASRYGQLLGCFPSPELVNTPFRLAPGEAMVMFTDGVTEARAGSAFFGEDGLITFLQRHAASGYNSQQLTDLLIGEVVGIQGGVPRDDIAVVVIQPSPGLGASDG